LSCHCGVSYLAFRKKGLFWLTGKLGWDKRKFLDVIVAKGIDDDQDYLSGGFEVLYIGDETLGGAAGYAGVDGKLRDVKEKHEHEKQTHEEMKPSMHDYYYLLNLI
jgi:hypothetical protein